MRPFFVVTPLGLPMRPALLAAIEAFGVHTCGHFVLADWPRAATALYQRRSTEEAERRAQAYERAWEEHPREAHVVWLEDVADHARLVVAKPQLRARFRSQQLGPLCLHSFHVPDAGDVDAELARLEHSARRR